MLKYVLIVLLALPFEVLGQNAKTPSHLLISKVKMNGYDCFTTPYFEICPSYSQLQGKIVYIPNARFFKKQSFLTIYLKIDDCPIISKLKEMFNKASERNLSIRMVAESYSFYVCREHNMLSYFGETWDGYEECKVMCITFPLALCMTDNQNKCKNRNNFFKKKLKESKFKKIHIECREETIDIPLEFPLNETIIEIEKVNVFCKN